MVTPSFLKNSALLVFVVVLILIIFNIFIKDNSDVTESALVIKDMPWKERLPAFKEVVENHGIEAGWNILEANKYLPVGDLPLFMGDELYKIYGIEGTQYCRSEFLSGCIAGVIRAEIVKNGTKNINDVCLLVNECSHGIGHGIIVFENLDIIEALGVCDGHFEGQDRVTCWEGIFQEYTYRSTHNVDELTSPFTPCANLSGGHLDTCFQLQPILWGYHFGLRYYEMAALCEKADSNDLKLICYAGVGEGVGRRSKGNYKYVENVCSSLASTKEAKDSCLAGASVDIARYFK